MTVAAPTISSSKSVSTRKETRSSVVCALMSVVCGGTRKRIQIPEEVGLHEARGLYQGTEKASREQTFSNPARDP